MINEIDPEIKSELNVALPLVSGNQQILLPYIAPYKQLGILASI